MGSRQATFENLPCTEDLAQLAASQYRLAEQFCDTCRNYHTIWPYRRLARVGATVEAGAPDFEATLGAFFKAGQRRVLIAGAADAGLLALTARVGLAYEVDIVVLDRCRTPLELCRQFAQRWSPRADTLHQLDFGQKLNGLAMVRGAKYGAHQFLSCHGQAETVTKFPAVSVYPTKYALPRAAQIGQSQDQDLTNFEMAAEFDVVFANSILLFIAPERRVDVLSRLRRALRPEGRLINVFNVGARVCLEGHARSILAELERRGVPLPESQEAFTWRLNDYAIEFDLRETTLNQLDRVLELHERAGFTVLRCAETDMGLTSRWRQLVANLARQRYLIEAEPARKRSCH